MQNHLVHLARKWRSANFDGIVGQDLAVRILKNSLYTGKLFPVYLLAGQHGCGKTTTARVFAAAVNCEKLSDFQHDPKVQPVPCLCCNSCQAMAAGRHPDFHEIDAASHTGVDHARQIVEAASMAPLIGRRKIYLIDEAHMLSKAAFNALLKMLEEPPASALFMLATTDDQKILETVKSRSFQLFFNAVPTVQLQAYLERVCQAEAIEYEPEALQMLIKETGGSVRDALNLVEQVFLSAQRVGCAELVQVLGYLPAAHLLKLFEQVVHAVSAQEVLACLQQMQVETYNPEYVWQQWIRLVHMAVWQAYGLQSADCPVDSVLLQQTLVGVTAAHMVALCTIAYEYEPLFAKTAHKTLLLPMMLVRCWQQLHQVPVSQQEPRESQAIARARVSVPQVVPQTGGEAGVDVISWQQWLDKLEQTGDSLLASVFKQGVFESVDRVSGVVTVRFAHRLSLFNDTIQQRTTVWEPLIKEVFGSQCCLTLRFVKDEPGVAPATSAAAQAAPRVASSCVAPPCVAPPVYAPAASPRTGERIDVSDKERWPVTHALLQNFSGVVVKVPTIAQEGEPHE